MTTLNTFLLQEDGSYIFQEDGQSRILITEASFDDDSEQEVDNPLLKGEIYEKS